MINGHKNGKLSVFVSQDLFIYLMGSITEGEREIDTFNLLIHPGNDYNSWGWSRRKP